MTYTFEQLEKEVNEGEILSQGKEGDVLWMIIRGPFCLCAYVGIDRINPLSPNYGDIDLDVHGGLTYGEIGDGGFGSDVEVDNSVGVCVDVLKTTVGEGVEVGEGTGLGGCGVHDLIVHPIKSVATIIYANILFISTPFQVCRSSPRTRLPAVAHTKVL